MDMRIVTFSAHHEAASKFVGQKNLRLIIQQVNRLTKPTTPVDFCQTIRFNRGRTVQVSREKPMKKLVFAILLIASPAWAQTKLLPKGATARVDNCAPIGRTEDGKLVYSMKCENLPAPPPPPPQAETRDVPAPEPEVQRSGIFGWSYERKRPGE
jgi:hypothetical protein